MRNILFVLALTTTFCLNAQNPLTTLGLTNTTPAKGAYSLRQVSSSYSGPVISIRKAGSTTTQNINFNNSIVDTNTIKTYCGNDTCYVYIWYDQSGNGLDMIQSSPTQQPIISINGVIMRKNGLPTIFFDFNAPSPNTSNVVGLQTIGFNLRNGNTLSMTACVVGGINKPAPFSTLISKTYTNLPDPFDAYGDSYLVGNGNTYYANGYYNNGMWNAINQANTFNVWSYTLKGTIINGYYHSHPGTLSSYSYYNGYLNSAFHGNKPLYNNSQYNSAFIIGSRADGQTALNGWVSEVILFPDYYGPSNHDSIDLNPIMERVNNNLISYYRIDKGSNFSHEYNENFKRNNLNKLSVDNLDQIVVAYSLRRLSDAYTKPILAIRRGSDNAIANVDFDANGKVSIGSNVTLSGSTSPTTQLGQFCQNTDCYVTKWYNQSGDDSLYAYQDSVIYQPQIVTNGVLNEINDRTTIYFDTSATYGPTFLKTKPFQAFNEQSDTKLGFDSYVAGGVKNNTSANTFFSKTYQNLPGPWDIYNNSMLFGCGNPDYYNFASCKLNKPINASSGFNIWQFYANPQMISSGPQQGVYDFPYANINTLNNDTNQFVPTGYTYYDAGHPIYIGSRHDHHTSLNGWISELLIFSIAPKFRPGRQEALFENMMGYYDIGKTGNCLSFLYDDKSYVNIQPNNGVYKAGSAYTKEAWIYLRAGYGDVHLISSTDIFKINSSYLVASNADGTDNKVVSSATIPKNKWVHVAVTYDGANTMSLYVNGEPSGSISNATSSHNTNTVFLGRNHQNSRFFNGIMDEVRIWNVARSAQEIKANYNVIINQGQGLIAYYNFDQGIAQGNNQKITTLLNNVIPGNEDFNGSLINFTLSGLISNWLKSSAGIK